MKTHREQNFQLVPIQKLRPDSEQPRKYLNEESLDEMAISIRNEGIINPIEVDENFVIITGERRWRAAKIAGLKEVPVKVLEYLTPNDRFVRQVQENIHQNTMSAWDTATALERIRTILSGSEGSSLVRDSKHQSKRSQLGILEVHKLLGIPQSTISEYLSLLTETGEMKDALQDPSFSRTKIREMKEAPEEYKEQLKKLVATQRKMPRDTVRHIAVALKRASHYGEHEAAKKLLEMNYEKLGSFDALSKINKIVPDEQSRIKSPADATRAISEIVISCMDLLDSHPMESFDPFHADLVKRDITALGMYLSGYIRGVNMKDLALKNVKDDRKQLKSS